MGKEKERRKETGEIEERKESWKEAHTLPFSG